MESFCQFSNSVERVFSETVLDSRTSLIQTQYENVLERCILQKVAINKIVDVRYLLFKNSFSLSISTQQMTLILKSGMIFFDL
jgi:hypothetical protein